MAFLDDLKTKQDGIKRKGYTPTAEQKEAAAALCSQKELIWNEVLFRAGMKGKSAKIQYQNLSEILVKRDEVSKEIRENQLREDDSVIGGVSELVCKLGLEAGAPNRYTRLPKGWDWIGDYAITGLPFNLYVSVKSYYARERLIVSGTGQGAAPVIGFGFFKDPDEWSVDRVQQYRHRGFVAIYMPATLLDEIRNKGTKGCKASEVKNSYNRPLLRDIRDFASDIENVISSDNLIIDLNQF